VKTVANMIRLRSISVATKLHDLDACQGQHRGDLAAARPDHPTGHSSFHPRQVDAARPRISGGQRCSFSEDSAYVTGIELTVDGGVAQY
jgi:hypothetical protein